MDEPHNQLQPVSGAGSNASREELLYLADQERHIRGMLHPDDHGELRASVVKEYALRSIAQCGVHTEQEPAAWWANCEKTGGQMVRTSGLKDMLIEEADRIYAEHGYVLRPLYAAAPSLSSADGASK